jgi:predicted amidohydrolase
VSDWDIVLRGGCVIDPESGPDEVRDVAIAAGQVAGSGTGPGSWSRCARRSSTATTRRARTARLRVR